MRSTYLLAALLFATPALGQAPIDPKVQARIDRILKATPLIDGHNDLPEQLVENYRSRVERLDQGTALWTPKPLMTDMARLRQVASAGNSGRSISTGRWWATRPFARRSSRSISSTG